LSLCDALATSNRLLDGTPRERGLDVVEAGP
jgi:hypothetical protein